MRLAIIQALLLSTVAAKSYTGQKIAVIIDAGTTKADYSQFFDSLTNRGFELTYNVPKDEPKFFELGERVFDHAIIFPQKSKGLGPSLTAQELAKFVDAGGNLLIGASTSAAASIRDFAKELEIDLAERDTLMVDHFNYDASSDEKHTTIVSSRFTENPNILSQEVRDGSPVLFKGVGHSLGNGPLLSPILGASRSAYSYDTKEEFEAAEDPFVAGEQAWLVSAIQARNNARVTVTGSVEMFSNAAFNAQLGDGKQSGNALFARDITRWTFQEKSVIRALDMHHSLSNETRLDSPDTYRVKEEVTFEISLQEYTDGKWAPYIAQDVQMELIMLDPYIRKTLLDISPKQDFARYKYTFTLPDHYGVFHFKVNYKRPGLTWIEERSQVTIRHFRHDEYPRFLTAAYPYYTASATTMLSFVIFCVAWLFHTPTPATTATADGSKSDKKTN